MYNRQSEQHAAQVVFVLPATEQTSISPPQLFSSPRFIFVASVVLNRSRSLLYGRRPGQPSETAWLFSAGVSSIPSPPLHPPAKVWRRPNRWLTKVVQFKEDKVVTQRIECEPPMNYTKQGSKIKWKCCTFCTHPSSWARTVDRVRHQRVWDMFCPAVGSHR